MIKFLKRIIFGDRPGKQAQLASCASPMERLFVSAGWDVLRKHGLVIAQYPLKKYRLDVAIPEHRIAIEIDGNEYHNSEMQTEKDKARDRAVMLGGWIVIRYPGREVYRDAYACAVEAGKIIEAMKERR